MAINQIFKHIEGTNRTRPVPEGTASGDFLIVGGRPAVAITGRGGDDVTETIGSVTVSRPITTVPDGQATLAFTGTWEHEVTGATTSTASDVNVYLVPGTGGDPDTLSLTEGATGVYYGRTDYPIDYVKTAGIAPVLIGVPENA